MDQWCTVRWPDDKWFATSGLRNFIDNCKAITGVATLAEFVIISIRGQSGKEIFCDEYDFIYTLIGNNKDDVKFYWTYAHKTTCKSHVHVVNGQLLMQWYRVLTMKMKVEETLFTMQYRDAAKKRLKLFRADDHCQYLYNDMYGSGIDDSDHILIFESDDNLNLLLRYRQWLADGTFRCLPAVFYQLFTLRVYIQGSVVPAQTYQQMLLEFSKLRQFNPESILTDFERTVINALQFLFPNVSQSGCFYHFSQSIYRVLPPNSDMWNFKVGQSK
ncbi:hypothetical protein RF11_10475 [Thelohanellus kitauei]|uniref:Uncharacterized protein n=1 Tax=Thelohanellus kitauei TaxID=669202 RepID=A0A0C2M398_THEKT|nr:hypothetical protein RF11_10475 [Thelohanellus kitauei]